MMPLSSSELKSNQVEPSRGEVALNMISRAFMPAGSQLRHLTTYRPRVDIQQFV